MLLRVFAIAITLIVTAPIGQVSAHQHAAVGLVTASQVAAAPVDTTPTGDTINEFYPEERSLGDCLSSLPKPGCGSDARGGWRQTLVFAVILAGLAFIAWRIVVQSRKARS